MSRFGEFALGKCLEMCPKKELEMREKERLLHVLEMIPGTEKCPKADPNRVVKEFSRSAAGKSINEDNLRPPAVLLKTVSYLLIDVMDVQHLPWHTVYDFITDRLRAVRQDMVVQNVGSAETISMLEPIIKFHAYAAYRLCCEDLAKFDPVLNRNHLQECLKKLLGLYDDYDDLIRNDNHHSSTLLLTDDGDSNRQLSTTYLLSSRSSFEALYLMVNLGNEEALRRIIALPKRIRSLTIIQNAFRISYSYRTGNIVKACKMMRQLPALLAATASLHLPQIRKEAFKIMSVAYNSKNLSFCFEDLQHILLYSHEKDLVQDCKYFGLRVERGNGVVFSKSLIIDKTAAKTRHEQFVDEKLKNENLQCLILFRTAVD